jgi:hypothetical protein
LLKGKEKTMEEDNSNDTPEAQLLRLFMQKLMGKSLDYARISGMSDRSFEQTKKNLKDDYYALLEHFIKLMDDLKQGK